MQGKIIKISDGDTITFAESATQTIKVRLYGIDSPELNQAYGKEAAAFATHIALWQAAKLAVQTTDQYNRSVAIVTLEDGTNLNELLVATGNAWVYRQFCNTPECIKWIALEDQAKHNRLGLWAQKQPLAPWLWRA